MTLSTSQSCTAAHITTQEESIKVTQPYPALPHRAVAALQRRLLTSTHPWPDSKPQLDPTLTMRPLGLLPALPSSQTASPAAKPYILLETHTWGPEHHVYHAFRVPCISLVTAYQRWPDGIPQPLPDSYQKILLNMLPTRLKHKHIFY